ncbi:MAG: hypothetical protein ABEH38_04880 [Flavobacteriales bacterium]
MYPKHSEQKGKEKTDGKWIQEEYCSPFSRMSGKTAVSGTKRPMRSDAFMKERIRGIKKDRDPMVPFRPFINDREISAVARYVEHFNKTE